MKFISNLRLLLENKRLTKELSVKKKKLSNIEQELEVLKKILTESILKYNKLLKKYEATDASRVFVDEAFRHGETKGYVEALEQVYEHCFKLKTFEISNIKMYIDNKGEE